MQSKGHCFILTDSKLVFFVTNPSIVYHSLVDKTLIFIPKVDMLHTFELLKFKRKKMLFFYVTTSLIRLVLNVSFPNDLIFVFHINTVIKQSVLDLNWKLSYEI